MLIRNVSNLLESHNNQFKIVLRSKYLSMYSGPLSTAMEQTFMDDRKIQHNILTFLINGKGLFFFCFLIISYGNSFAAARLTWRLFSEICICGPLVLMARTWTPHLFSIRRQYQNQITKNWFLRIFYLFKGTLHFCESTMWYLLVNSLSTRITTTNVNSNEFVNIFSEKYSSKYRRNIPIREMHAQCTSFWVYSEVVRLFDYNFFIWVCGE